MKWPRREAGNQRTDEKKPAKTEQTGSSRDKDRRHFQLVRRLNHAGTITTGRKKIEQEQRDTLKDAFAPDSPVAAMYDGACVQRLLTPLINTRL